MSKDGVKEARNKLKPTAKLSTVGGKNSDNVSQYANFGIKK